MLVLAVVMDDDEVVLLPVVALAVVDLVPAAFEDVEVGLVLMAVAEVGAAGHELDEVDLERLREELLVTRAEHPIGLRLVGIGVAGMADARIVDDRARAPDAVLAALQVALLAQAIGLRADAAQERATVLTHFALPQPAIRTNGMTFDLRPVARDRPRRPSEARCRTGGWAR